MTPSETIALTDIFLSMHQYRCDVIWNFLVTVQKVTPLLQIDNDRLKGPFGSRIEPGFELPTINASMGDGVDRISPLPTKLPHDLVETPQQSTPYI